MVGTLNILGLAKRVGARFLLTSTSEVYGDPLEHPQKSTGALSTPLVWTHLPQVFDPSFIQTEVKACSPGLVNVLIFNSQLGTEVNCSLRY